MSVKRYDFELVDDRDALGVRTIQRKTGKYVTHEDYAALERLCQQQHEALVKALSKPVSEIWFQQWKPIINAIGEISVQEAMDAIERGL